MSLDIRALKETDPLYFMYNILYKIYFIYNIYSLVSWQTEIFHFKWSSD